MHPHIQSFPPNSSNITVIPWIRRFNSIRPPILIERAILGVQPGARIDVWSIAVVDGDIGQRWPEVRQIFHGEGTLVVQPCSLFVISISIHGYISVSIYQGEKGDLQSYSATGHNPHLDWQTQEPYCPGSDQHTTAALHCRGAVGDKRWYQSGNCSLADCPCCIGLPRRSLNSGTQPDTPA